MSYKNFTAKKKIFIIVAIIIFLIGIFLRTYHFRDWLQFSPDEARDATLIGAAIEGKAALPALGPQAGNTQFYLGPLYYQGEYVAALLFGNSPDKIAYFDLFFSILAIPLLFVFLRKYFSTRMALFLSALLSVSYFAIKISRFASNPNSIPFFALIFLLGLLGLLEKENNKKYFWASLVGIGMGVGIQLHALLFLIMPVVALGVCGYLIAKKNLSWKSFFLVVFFFLLANYGQLAYEFKSGGANVGQLFKGASSESNVGGSALLRNVSLVASCQAQANINIVFSPIDMEKCGAIFNVAKSFKSNKLVPAGPKVNGGLFILEMIVTLIFSFGGYALLWRYLRKEKDGQKRNFLGLFVFYNLVSWAVLLPVASQIEVRYFSILFFVPFVLLGLWLNFLFEKKKQAEKNIFLGLAIFFLVANVWMLLAIARPYLEQRASDVNNSILGETQNMLAYLMANADQQKLVYIDGQTFYLKRFLKPFDYLAQQSGATMVRPGNKQPFASGTKFFFIDGSKAKPTEIGKTLNSDLVLGYQKFGNIIIYTLIKK